MRIEVPRRLRNTNRHPEKGSAWFVLALPGEGVDALPAIDRFDRHQDAHLRCDLDHTDSHSARLNPARSGTVAPFHWMRILPRGPSN
jgi:hypothetical protein